MTVSDHVVDRFWRWLAVEFVPRFDAPVDLDLVAELGRQVSALGPFDFEVGPQRDACYFALSPRGSAVGYAATQAMVARAP